LGNDAPLYTKPEPSADQPHVRDDISVPGPIRRRELEEQIVPKPGEQETDQRRTRASARYYGEAKSVAIYAQGWPQRESPQPIPRDNVIPADLTDWHYRAGRNEVAVDPVLGRIAFPVGHAPRRVWVTYHYGFSADMGGGEYDPPVSEPLAHAVFRVCKDPKMPDDFRTINDALNEWSKKKTALGPEPADEAGKTQWQRGKENLRAAVIEIQDSSVYAEALEITLAKGESLQIRGALHTRPVIQGNVGSFTISGMQGSRFKLDGVWVVGHSIDVNGPDREDASRFAEGDLCDVTIRHATLVPGLALDCDCEPKPSLRITESGAKIRIDHSIVGRIEVIHREVTGDPVEILANDSIVDA